MAREDMGSDVDPGFMARIAAGVRYAITGVGPENWFGPQQPLTPQAQEQAQGRQFDYPVGINLRITPRSEEGIGFSQLRCLADGYDLLRLVIETRKDQIESYEWEIVPVDKDANVDSMKDDIKRVSDFLQYPDQEHDWPQWLRLQLEELLVIDALCVYPAASRDGTLYALELVDGATIKRLLDDGGRTPLPPNPAYQQILKGIPAADYTREQLIYRSRNPRVNRIYGYSPVEQVMMTVNIAMRRQLTQLDVYTKGNIPEAIAQVPEGWSMQQIAEFQTWWDSVMLGVESAKRQIKFIPSLDGIVFPKDKLIKDEYDEWLARIICFAFSISPSALIKQVNRASGEQMADTAKEEGLFPLLRFMAGHVTYLIHNCMGLKNLKFQWKTQNKVAPKEQADIYGIYVDKKVLTPDEVREEIGRDPMTPEDRENAFPTPPDPIEVAAAQAEAQAKTDAGKPPKKEGNNAPPQGPPKTEKPTATEKALADAMQMLASCLEKLDPERQTELLAKLVKSQPPHVVELKPQVNVDVGDTVVNMPPARLDPKPVDPPADPHLDKVLVASRRADGSMVAKWESES